MAITIKVIATMRRPDGDAAVTKAESPKRVRKNRDVRASPYAGGVIPPLSPAEKFAGMDDPLERWLTPEDAAAFLNMSTSILEKRRKHKPNEPPFKKR